MPRSPDETRSRLVAAGERLFAERGLEAVSLREITREAGQRNATALQYHFADRRGLLRAILAKHEAAVEEHRHALLDAALETVEPELRALASALVDPLAAKLGDRDGGREYLRIMADLMNRPEPKFAPGQLQNPRASLNRWRRAVAPLLPDLAVDPLHRRFSVIRIASVELGRRAAAPRRRDDRLFASHLVDLVTGCLGAPLSSRTRGLLREREKRRRRSDQRA